MVQDIIKEKLEKMDCLKVEYGIPLKKYTSINIGGPAEIFLTPYTITAFQKILPILNKEKVPFFILGRGSNLIISDKGFPGAIIYTGNLNQVEIKKKEISAECGISLAALANKAMKAGLSGLEFASGIPGTLGGAVYMNAGAYNGEIKDIITEAVLHDYNGQEYNLKNEELQFSYRYSILQKKPLIIVKAKLKLKTSNKELIKATMKKLNKQRKEKQPLEWPNAGSVFKRPKNNFAGTLIEQADLKGLRIGDAQVSKKHAGFIINLGKATANDVRLLIRKVQEEVYKKSGVKLEPEPKFIGDFD